MNFLRQGQRWPCLFELLSTGEDEAATVKTLRAARPLRTAVDTSSVLVPTIRKVHKEDNSMDRREFMKSTVAGLGGVIISASHEDAAGKPAIGETPGRRKLVYRTLGKTGISVPVISMGAMGSLEPQLIRAALDAGVAHLDTAYLYVAGQSERNMGKVIAGRPRDSYFIATKVYLPMGFEYAYTEKPLEEVVQRQLSASLERLGLSHVDILYVHDLRRRDSVLFDPLKNIMENVRKEGKTRFVGVSTHENQAEVIQAATDSKFYDVVQTSYNFKQKNHMQIREAIDRAAQAGLGILVMKVMGGSFGNYGSITGNARAAIKWVLQHPNVHTAIMGFSSFDELEQDLSVMEDLTLTDSDKKDLQLEASVPGLYCQGCRQCMGQCRGGLPITDLMRAYMYCYGYRNIAFPRDLVLSLNLPQGVCRDCSRCTVKCSIGFDVRAKIRDIIRLRDVPPEFVG